MGEIIKTAAEFLQAAIGPRHQAPLQLTVNPIKAIKERQARIPWGSDNRWAGQCNMCSRTTSRSKEDPDTRATTAGEEQQTILVIVHASSL
jgi:hypothetical protein